MKRKFVLAVAAVLATVSLSGCDWSTHSSSDYGNISHAPADVLEFPDGYRNVAHKCDGPNMVYSGSASSGDSLSPAIAVAPNDPRCVGK